MSDKPREVQTDYRRATRNLLTREQFRWARSYNSKAEIANPPPPFDLESFLDKAREYEQLVGIISAMAEIQERFRTDAVKTQPYARELIDSIKQRIKD